MIYFLYMSIIVVVSVSFAFLSATSIPKPLQNIHSTCVPTYLHEFRNAWRRWLAMLHTNIFRYTFYHDTTRQACIHIRHSTSESFHQSLAFKIPWIAAWTTTNTSTCNWNIYSSCNLNYLNELKKEYIAFIMIVEIKKSRQANW